MRQELNNLKNCQITFLTFSVTTTALLLGITIIPASNAIVGVLPFSPLLILLPSWWIFTDKATTITRIVGYYRFLENLILGKATGLKFYGWENALERFRQLQREEKLKLPANRKRESKIKCLMELAILKTIHSYWVITWYTFFGLSMLCLVLSIFSFESLNRIPIVIATVIVLISAIHNGRVVWNLIYGKNSYSANEYFWKIVLKE